MSSQADLNTYPWQFVLYYCHIGNADATVYQTDLSDVCTLGFDGSGNLTISSWLIGGYSAPSPATLMGYTLAAVLADYDLFYAIPIAIRADQPYQISAANLAAIRSDASLLGCIVYDTTNNGLKTWNGSIWISGPETYLLLSGGNTMTGGLNLGTHAITGVTNLAQSTPSASSIWSSDAVAVAFTANTPQVVDITGFTDVLDPNSDFTVTTTTGKVQYTGSATRYFRVAIEYSTTKLIPLTTQTLTTFIAKNGSTTIGKRGVETFLLTSVASIDMHTLTDVIQLAQNDYIQLGGQYTATTNVTFSNVSVCVSQV